MPPAIILAVAGRPPVGAASSGAVRSRSSTSSALESSRSVSRIRALRLAIRSSSTDAGPARADGDRQVPGVAPRGVVVPEDPLHGAVTTSAVRHEPGTVSSANASPLPTAPEGAATAAGGRNAASASRRVAVRARPPRVGRSPTPRALDATG